MTRATDDLAPFLAQPDGEFAGYAQGVLLDFDPDTFSNTVQYRGAILTNLPIKDRIGALTYQAGDVVQLSRWVPTGKGAGSYWIDGAPVTPGTGRAEEAIEFLTTSLAQRISAQVFADRIHFAEIATAETTTSTTYGDLATVGPTVPDVEITSGTAIVFLGASILAVMGVADIGVGGRMAVEVSGATSIAPSPNDEFNVALGQTLPPGESLYGRVRGSAVRVVSGLNPGTHTFAAKYRAESTGELGSFALRTVVVIAL